MYQIIQPTPDDFDELTCLWEASVRATHHFIPEAYIQKLKPLVWSVYLHSMPLYMIRDNAGIEGFMGINGTMLEMLFVHPRAIGTGIGKQLIRYALEHCHVRYVDVNEPICLIGKDAYQRKDNQCGYGFKRYLHGLAKIGTK